MVCEMILVVHWNPQANVHTGSSFFNFCWSFVQKTRKLDRAQKQEYKSIKSEEEKTPEEMFAVEKENYYKTL